MIGIIDSGMGGLTTLATLAAKGCDNRFCYFADTANAPYGNKDKGRILHDVSRAADTLLRSGADRIVLGCNTATVAAMHYLRRRLPCPVDGVTPPVRQAMEAGGSVLVLSTAFTGEYIRAIYRHIRTLTMPSLATLVDRFFPDDMAPIEHYLKDKLCIVRAVDNVVLGCTHYLLLKREICQIIHAKRAFDANEALADRIEKRPSTRGIGVDIIASGPLDEGRYLRVLESLMA